MNEILEFARRLSTISVMSFEECETLANEIVMNRGDLSKGINIYNKDGMKGLETYIVMLRMGIK